MNRRNMCKSRNITTKKHINKIIQEKKQINVAHSTEDDSAKCS